MGTVVALGLSSCSAPPPAATASETGANAAGGGEAPTIRVAATTPIITDMVSQVAGNRATVTGLIPDSADPHVFEPRLSTVRTVANADVVFSNGLLLEEQSMQRTLEAHLHPDARHVSLGDGITEAGGHLLPLVERASLDTVWLGFRVDGRKHDGAKVRLRFVDTQGPGNVDAFITGTFGTPEELLSSRDRSRDALLPQNAHTHLSWAFSAAGYYTVRVAADLVDDAGSEVIEPLAQQELHFAVGVPPQEFPGAEFAAEGRPAEGRPAEGHGAEAHPGNFAILDKGHQDITVDLPTNSIALTGDEDYDPARTVIAVPPVTLQILPADPSYRFLGRPQDEVYMLHQAVLGKHIHGDVDPHIWLDPRNGIAMVRIIAESLATADPAGREGYYARAAAYEERIRSTAESVQRSIDGIVPARRQLVTTHDGYGYFADRFGLDVAGFVSPNPAVQPSPRDIRALRETLRGLRVPSVFVQPNTTAQTRDLLSAAQDEHVSVCTLYGDSFGPDIDSYLQMLQTNGRNLKRCLSGPSNPSGPGGHDST